VPSKEEQEKTKKQMQGARRQRPQERRQYDEMVVEAALFKHIKDPNKEKLGDAIRNRVDSYSKTILKTSSGLMHMATEMYRDVTDIKTVEIPDEILAKTFVRHLIFGTGEARRENVLVHTLHENFTEFRFEGTRCKGDSNIYIHGAMMYITNLKNHLTMNLERFMRRAVFALYPGISRKGIWAIINGITNDRKHEDEVEFVHKKALRRSTNKAAAIRAAIREHRAVLGLANPTDKISELKKDKERCNRLVLRCFVFLDRKLEVKPEMKLSEEKNEEWERRKAFLMGKRFNVVPMCTINSHFL
jgi:hypothetical protein